VNVEDRNVIKKEVSMILRFQYHSTEMQCVCVCVWNVKTDETPRTICPNGTISNSVRKYFINIPGKHDVNDLQKTAILVPAQIPRQVPMYNYKNFNMGNNGTSAVYCNNGTSAVYCNNDTSAVYCNNGTSAVYCNIGKSAVYCKHRIFAALCTSETTSFVPDT